MSILYVQLSVARFIARLAFASVPMSAPNNRLARFFAVGFASSSTGAGRLAIPGASYSAAGAATGAASCSSAALWCRALGPASQRVKKVEAI